MPKVINQTPDLNVSGFSFQSQFLRHRVLLWNFSNLMRLLQCLLCEGVRLGKGLSTLLGHHPVHVSTRWSFHLSDSYIHLVLLRTSSLYASGVHLSTAKSGKCMMQVEVDVAPIREGNRGEASACRDDSCVVSTMKKRVFSRPPGKPSKGWLPSIQEDYYGPRHHRPRHHKH